MQKYHDPLGLDDKSGKDTLETRILLQPLMLLLDSSTDIVQERSGAKQCMTVIETKKTLCDCLSLMMSIRLKLRVNKALQVYDHDLQNGLVFHVERGDEAQKKAKGAGREAPRPDFENIFQIMRHDKPLLTRILADLLKFNDRDLDNSALNIMIRVHSERYA
jgi:hypothetical protein